MNTSVSTRVLSQLLKAVLPAVSKASHHPALKCVKLVAHSGGVSLSATNNELAVTAHAADNPPLRPGACLLDAERLKSILSALPDGDLAITLDGEKVKLKGARSKYDLTAIKVDEFPDPVTEGEKSVSCEISASVLCTLLERTVFAVSRASNTKAGGLHGVALTLSPDALTAIGTDSFRLSIARHQFGSPVDGRNCSVIVPQGAVAAILSALTDPHEHVHLTLGNLLTVQTERLRLQTATVTHSKLLAYDKILAQHVKKAGVTVDIDAGELLGAIRQAATMTSPDDSRVEFAFAPTGLILSIQGAFGALEVECPVLAYSGTETNFAADPVFMRDFLAVRGDESSAPLTLRIIGPEQPFVFEAADNWQYLMAAMVDPK